MWNLFDEFQNCRVGYNTTYRLIVLEVEIKFALYEIWNKEMVMNLLIFMLSFQWTKDEWMELVNK